MQNNRSKSQQKRDELFKSCNEIATMSDVLSQFEKELHGCTFAGDIKQAKLLFLTLHTRFSDQPVSVVVKGPSSGGKSFLVNTILKFLPPTAYEALTGMSEKALVYWDADLQHKYLFVQEASGLQNPQGNWLLRSLLSEGQLRYTVTVKVGDKYATEEITQKGPTGLLLTTTANTLHFEDETRMLSLTVDDSSEHTRRVILEQAASYTGEVRASPDFDRWHKFHDWIAAGPHRVLIPYANELGQMVEPLANRLKRDFAQVLSLIEASALVHQHNRQCDDGWIIADIDDYRLVWELVADIVSVGVEATVSKEVRETVEAVRALKGKTRALKGKTEEPLQEKSSDWDGLPLFAVAEKLQLDKGSASRRVKEACRLGYLENLEQRKGRTAKLILGKPLPEDRKVLPAPEELAVAVSRSAETAVAG